MTQFLAKFVVLLIAVAFLAMLPASAQAVEYMNPDKPVGGVVIVEQPFGPTQFAQALASGGAYWLSWNIYSRLVDFDHRGDIVPNLADTWDVSADAKTYTFHLNPGAKWHDGVPVTARDVEWFIDTVIAEKHPGISEFGNVQTTTVVDEATLRVTLKEPDGSFLTKLGIGKGYTNIVPRHLLEGKDWATSDTLLNNPVGSGPFKFVRYETGDFVVLEAVDDHFRGRPNIDRLILKIVPNIASALQQLETGELDALSSFIPYAEVPRLEADPDFTVTASPSLWATTFEFNTRQPPYDDVNVRRAISMAIDLEDVNEKVFNGLGTVHHGTYTSYVPWAFNPDAKYPAYNLALAEQLLDQANYPRGTDGVRFTMKVVSGDYAGFISEGVGAVIKEHLRAIGIEVEYQMLEWGTMIEQVFVNNQFEVHIFPGEWQGPDPAIVSDLYATDGLRNTMGYSNSEVDQLFKQGVASFDRDERKQAYYRIQEILAEEVPLIFINDAVVVYANRATFHGFPYELDVGFDSTPRYEAVWSEGGSVQAALIFGIDPVVLLYLGIGAAAAAVVVGGYLIVRRGRSKKEE